VTGVLVPHQGIETWFGIKVDEPICMIANASDYSMLAYQSVPELQIIQVQGSVLRALVGKRIRADGKLEPMVSGHHRTNVMIMVSSLKEVKGAPGIAGKVLPTNVSQSRRLTPDVYIASATVIPDPGGRVIKEARGALLKDLLPDPESLVRTMFNGPQDIMWVYCSEGYRLGEATSATSSRVFQMDPADPSNSYWGVAASYSERSNITVTCSKTNP